MKTKQFKGIKEVSEETYQKALSDGKADGYIWLTTVYDENNESIEKNIYLGNILYAKDKLIIDCGEY